MGDPDEDIIVMGLTAKLLVDQGTQDRVYAAAIVVAAFKLMARACSQRAVPITALKDLLFDFEVDARGELIGLLDDRISRAEKQLHSRQKYDA